MGGWWATGRVVHHGPVGHHGGWVHGWRTFRWVVGAFSAAHAHFRRVGGAPKPPHNYEIPAGGRAAKRRLNFFVPLFPATPCANTGPRCATPNYSVASGFAGLVAAMAGWYYGPDWKADGGKHSKWRDMGWVGTAVSGRFGFIFEHLWNYAILGAAVFWGPPFSGAMATMTSTPGMFCGP